MIYTWGCPCLLLRRARIKSRPSREKAQKGGEGSHRHPVRASLGLPQGVTRETRAASDREIGSAGSIRWAAPSTTRGVSHSACALSSPVRTECERGMQSTEQHERRAHDNPPVNFDMKLLASWQLLC